MTAWEKHVAEWKPFGENAERYASGRYMNKHFPNSVLRTQEEQKYDPYPDHLDIRCHNGLINADGKTEFDFGEREYGLACRILRRDERDGRLHYTVEVEYKGEEDEEFTRIVRADVPRQSLAFFDVPGTTDINLPNAFRHPIGIPDDIYPDRWKNLLDEEEEVGEDAAEEEEEAEDLTEGEDVEDLAEEEDVEDSADEEDVEEAAEEEEDVEEAESGAEDIDYEEIEEEDDDIVLYDDEILFEELALEDEERRTADEL